MTDNHSAGADFISGLVGRRATQLSGPGPLPDAQNAGTIPFGESLTDLLYGLVDHYSTRGSAITSWSVSKVDIAFAAHSHGNYYVRLGGIRSAEHYVNTVRVPALQPFHPHSPKIPSGSRVRPGDECKLQPYSSTAGVAPVNAGPSEWEVTYVT